MSLNLLETCLCVDDFSQPSPLPILVTNENEAFKISFECSHEEVYTRMIFRALEEKINIVVCSKDTDVLLLMVFFYALNKIKDK